MFIGVETWANHALQRTAASCSRSNRRVSWPPSLSLGRWASLRMPGFLRRFFLSDFGPPPPPDVAHLPLFTNQRIVETIYSDSKRERAIITVDDTGDYRIVVQWWDTSDWKAGHGAR